MVVWKCSGCTTAPSSPTLHLTLTSWQILTLLYGGGFYLFNPAHEGIKPGQGEYELAVLNRMYRYFGPFPDSFQEIADENASAVVDFTV
jgi:hypothetical protein